EERLAGTRKIRDQMRARIEMWCDEMCPVEAGAEDSITTLDRHKRRPAMSPRAIYCRRSQSFASLSNLATKQAACERKQTSMVLLNKTVAETIVSSHIGRV